MWKLLSDVGGEQAHLSQAQTAQRSRVIEGFAWYRVAIPRGFQHGRHGGGVSSKLSIAEELAELSCR
jgi:hypothetical protein